MSETIRETTVYPVRITLTARDQYNDYSVRHDYTLTVSNTKTGFRKAYDCGTSRDVALARYDDMVGTACRIAAELHAAN